MCWTAHTQASGCLIATHLLQNLRHQIWYTHTSTARGSYIHVLRSRFLIGKILPLIAWFVLWIYRGSKVKDMEFQDEQFMLWHKCRNNVLKIIIELHAKTCSIYGCYAQILIWSKAEMFIHVATQNLHTQSSGKQLENRHFWSMVFPTTLVKYVSSRLKFTAVLYVQPL